MSGEFDASSSKKEYLIMTATSLSLKKEWII